jgi:hypothetical protein
LVAFLVPSSGSPAKTATAIGSSPDLRIAAELVIGVKTVERHRQNTSTSSA